MEIPVNSRIELKKAHPCGGKIWIVKRAGMDFRIECETCGRDIWLPRTKLEKRIKKIL